MADDSHGVYVSIRHPNGALWSSSRATPEEVMKDVVATFGEGFYAAMLSEIRSLYPKKSAPDAERPTTTEEAISNIENVLGPVSPEEPGDKEPAPAAVPADPGPQEFEKCSECGHLKDKWNPPGVSKRTGKPYPGFFGCSNWRNHRKS